MTTKPRMITITTSEGDTYQIEEGAPVLTRLYNLREEQRRDAQAKVRTDAYDKVSKPAKEAFAALDENLKLSLAKETLVIRFNGKSIIECGIWESELITIRKRKPRKDANGA